MKVLSLFDGMACGMLAMQKAGIEVDRYVAYEIDKYAVQTSTHNFPVIEHRGDVFCADFTEFADFDFLVGGSPCTYWSVAKSVGRETEASGMGWELFRQYVRALHEAKPKFFVYENNKSMSKAIRASIDEAFGFEAIGINSALVSAQNRQRLYWVGKRNDDGTYSRVKVEQPEDRGILLKDILESGAKDRERIDSTVTTPVCLNSKSGRGGVEGLQPSLQNRIYSIDGKHPAVTAAYMPKIAEPVYVGTMPRPSGELSTSQAFRAYCVNGKSVGLTAASGEAGGKTYSVYEVKDGQITINGKTYPIKLTDGFYIIRKLTVKECMRLQTVPEWYEFPVSNTQAFEMLGNGWTCSIIQHLLEACLRSGT